MKPGASAAGLALLAAGIGYTAAVVGPPVAELGADFDVSLSTVGLLQSVYYLAAAVGPLAAAPVVHRAGAVRSVWVAALLLGGGSLLAAVSPTFTVLAVARVVAGLGTALGLVVGPVAARRLSLTAVGLFGAGITIGAGAALALGGVLVDADASWRIGFVVAAALGLVGAPLVRGRLPLRTAPARGALRHFVSEAVRRFAFWELLLLYVLTNLVPLVISVWLIQYVTAGGEMGPGVAGVLGFVLFGTNTVARFAGARATRLGALTVVLASCALAGAALVALALDRSLATAVPAVVALGAGFSLPYTVMISRSQRLDPDDPAVAMSAVQVIPNAMPIVAIPLMGWALDHGHGEAAFLALAAYAVVTALANLRWPAPVPA